MKLEDTDAHEILFVIVEDFAYFMDVQECAVMRWERGLKYPMPPDDAWDALARLEKKYNFAIDSAVEAALDSGASRVSLMFADAADDALAKTLETTRETVELYDFLEEVTYTCPILEAYELEDYGRFLVIDCPDIGRMAIIQAEDGTVFTPKQWDYSPKTLNEIPDFCWVDSHGVDAFVVDGLPRLF